MQQKFKNPRNLHTFVELHFFFSPRWFDFRYTEQARISKFRCYILSSGVYLFIRIHCLSLSLFV